LEKRDNRTLNSICKNRISDVKYDQNCCRWLKHWTLSNTQPLTYRNPLADVDQGLICLQCPIALFSHDTDHLRLLRRTKNHLLHDFLYIICLNLILFLYKRNNAECIFIYVYTIYIYILDVGHNYWYFPIQLFHLSNWASMHSIWEDFAYCISRWKLNLCKKITGKKKLIGDLYIQIAANLKQVKQVIHKALFAL